MRKAIFGLLLLFSVGVSAAPSTNQLWQISFDGAGVGYAPSYADALAWANTQPGNPYVACSGTVAVLLRTAGGSCAAPRLAIVLTSSRCPEGESLSADGLSCSVGVPTDSDPIGVLGMKLSDLMASIMIGLLVLVYGLGLAIGQQR